MTIPTPPYAAMDGILRRTRHLILDFDGPVCTLYARKPARLAADRLREILAPHIREIPSAVATATDPLAVLAYAAGISPQLAEQADAELTRYELSAAATAQPAGYSHDVIASAREGHRTITVISACSARAVLAYLDRASLDELVGLVVGRPGDAPEAAAERHLVGRALSALSADPATCTLVAESASVLASARASGIATIAYARTQAVQNLTSAHAEATVTSLADLVLRLRALPLPNWAVLGQGGTASGAAGPAPAPGSAPPRPAWHAAGQCVVRLAADNAIPASSRVSSPLWISRSNSSSELPVACTAAARTSPPRFLASLASSSRIRTAIGSSSGPRVAPTTAPIGAAGPEIAAPTSAPSPDAVARS